MKWKWKQRLKICCYFLQRLSIIRVEHGEEEVEDGEKSLVFHRGISTIAMIASI